MGGQSAAQKRVDGLPLRAFHAGVFEFGQSQRGMPFTNSTASGMIWLLPLAKATLN